MAFQTTYSHQDHTPSDPELGQIVAQQSQYLQKMHEELANQDQAFELLLQKVNNLQVQNTTTTLSNALKQLQASKRNANKSKMIASATPKQDRKKRLGPSQIPSGQKKGLPARLTVLAPSPNHSPRRNPNQMIMSEIPEGFKETKDVLFVHIKILWGLISQHAVPVAPNPALLQ
ncbi:hypothetical protein O181_000184 [Austropuccinia psidii MF-1]|uniref:Uncharacterized protein n=1 Tax=Austropuccinia psidii MF-1 TaxID=1389203 RepID=A0A9Q3B859_9BASI|nr:hypothetical protein [Austropuccinia psidii MF-1]